ncbi:uncharacterized protein [Eucyclogobius newberryi]|uniref:uncharacterized protein n=1 Tax=Eucyclogobius newberryi TaxID=166745 RepID=UPI003B5B511C
MAMAARLVLGLLLWTSSGGSIPQTLIVETNQDLLLEFKDEGQVGRNEMFLWRNSDGRHIVRARADEVTINDDYKGRVEFCPRNRSLTLRKVQLSDSGSYTAVVSRKGDEPVLTINVSVEAPVFAVCLRLDSVSSSSDSCNFTVICQTELFSLSRSFTCDTPGCEEPRPQHSTHAHSGSSSLHLYLSDRSIICNHSNHVSWTQDTKDVQQMCVTSETDEARVVSVCELKTVVYTVGLLLMLAAVITAHVLDHRSKLD